VLANVGDTLRDSQVGAYPPAVARKDPHVSGRSSRGAPVAVSWGAHDPRVTLASSWCVRTQRGVALPPRGRLGTDRERDMDMKRFTKILGGVLWFLPRAT